MEERLKLKDYFTTTDLCLCTTLTYFGFQLDSLDKTNPNRVVFIFKDTPELQDFINSYYREDLKVEPKQFFLQLKSVKWRLYGE